MRPASLRRAIGLVAGAVLAVACSDVGSAGDASAGAVTGSGPEAPARSARRFLPRDSAWIPESEVPSAPQREPAMVIWELDAAPHREATAREQAAAEALVARSLAVAERRGWFDFQRGRADGYRLLHGDRRHYYNEEYVFDDAILDPERPEFLMYYGTPRGQKLAGLMFYARTPTERGRQIGGPLTRWHYHVWAEPNCLVRGLLSVASPDAEGRCATGSPRHRSPEMLHVWFLDHPDGPFATSMWLQPAQLRALIDRDERRAAAAASQAEGGG